MTVESKDGSNIYTLYPEFRHSIPYIHFSQRNFLKLNNKRASYLHAYTFTFYVDYRQKSTVDTQHSRHHAKRKKTNLNFTGFWCWQSIKEILCVWIAGILLRVIKFNWILDTPHIHKKKVNSVTINWLGRWTEREREIQRNFPFAYKSYIYTCLVARF